MPAGRPTLYREEYPDQVRRLALLGLSDEEMADFFEVATSTLYLWDKIHPEFSEARARGKIPADAKVAERLYHRALGYRHEDVHITAFNGEVTKTQVIKHYPPDTQAATWWLKNRQPKKWQDKSTSEVTGANGGAIQIEDSRAPIASLITGVLPK
jgi:hypothetical protein